MLVSSAGFQYTEPRNPHHDFSVPCDGARFGPVTGGGDSPSWIGLNSGKSTPVLEVADSNTLNQIYNMYYQTCASSVFPDLHGNRTFFTAFHAHNGSGDKGNWGWLALSPSGLGFIETEDSDHDFTVSCNDRVGLRGDWLVLRIGNQNRQFSIQGFTAADILNRFDQGCGRR